MSTPPVTPAPPAKKENKFESFLSKFGTTLEKIGNASVNIAVEELPVFDQLLPPATAAELNTLVSFAAQQVASVDAKYSAIANSNVPYSVKVAEAVATGGLGAIALAAKAGFTLPAANLGIFFSGAGQIAAALNLTGITAAPKV